MTSFLITQKYDFFRAYALCNNHECVFQFCSFFVSFLVVHAISFMHSMFMCSFWLILGGNKLDFIPIWYQTARNTDAHATMLHAISYKMYYVTFDYINRQQATTTVVRLPSNEKREKERKQKKWNAFMYKLYFCLRADCCCYFCVSACSSCCYCCLLPDCIWKKNKNGRTDAAWRWESIELIEKKNIRGCMIPTPLRKPIVLARPYDINEKLVTVTRTMCECIFHVDNVMCM